MNADYWGVVLDQSANIHQNTHKLRNTPRLHPDSAMTLILTVIRGYISVPS